MIKKEVLEEKSTGEEKKAEMNENSNEAKEQENRQTNETLENDFIDKNPCSVENEENDMFTEEIEQKPIEQEKQDERGILKKRKLFFIPQSWFDRF